MESILIAHEEGASFLWGFLPIYGLILAVGFAGSFIWGYVDWNKNGYRTQEYIYLSIFVTTFALYGAKIWYMVFDPVNAFAGVNDILSFLYVAFIPFAGRSIIGSIVFAPLGIFIYKKLWGPELETWKVLDIMMPALLIGQAVGRWGNFANHQVYGEIVSGESLNWLPAYIKDNMFIKSKDGVMAYRSPLFLYESIANFATLMLIFVIFKTNKYWNQGCAGMAYIGLYGISRSSIELFRDPSFIMTWGKIPTSFIAALIMILVGFITLIFLQWGNNIKTILKYI